MRNLAIARKLKDMSQKELAKRTGVSVQAISNYEIGIQEPTSSRLIKFADELGVTIDFLCGRERI